LGGNGRLEAFSTEATKEETDMPVLKKDINTRSLDEFFVSAQQVEVPKCPPTIKTPRMKVQTTLPGPMK
jgi:hypothetical protein